MRTATLIEPYLGYRNIILIEKWDTKWKWRFAEVANIFGCMRMSS